MCNIACLEFGMRNLKEEDVRGKAVIEVGSYDVNGSLRPITETPFPASYTGTDVEQGPWVDEICDACDLLEHLALKNLIC